MTIRSSWLIEMFKFYIPLCTFTYFSSKCYKRSIEIFKYIYKFVYFSFLYYQFLMNVFQNSVVQNCYICFLQKLTHIRVSQHSLYLAQFLVLKIILSDVNVAIPASYCQCLNSVSFFHPCTFNQSMYLYLKCVLFVVNNICRYLYFNQDVILMELSIWLDLIYHSCYFPLVPSVLCPTFHAFFWIELSFFIFIFLTFCWLIS